VELLLVTQQQVSAGEASRAFGALEGLLLCVGALVAFQVLEAGKGALAGCADVRAGLIGLWWGEGGGSFCVDGDGGGDRVVGVGGSAGHGGGSDGGSRIGHDERRGDCMASVAIEAMR
jgi:hypothetical protein